MTVIICPTHKIEFTVPGGCPKCLAERRVVAEQFKGYPANEVIVNEAIIQEAVDQAADEKLRSPKNDVMWLDGGVKLVGDKVVEPAPEQPETTAVALRPGEDLKMRKYHEEGLQLLKYAEARVIATLEDNKLASDDLSIISKYKKAMKAREKEQLEPLKEQSDAIRTTYIFLMSPILSADEITRSKMLAFEKEQRRIRAEEEEINRKRQEAADQEMKLKGELTQSVNLVEVTPAPAKSVKTDMGSSGTVDHWKYEVIDESLIPREYLMVDTVMLSAIAKRYHDNKQIAGVRFYNEPIIANRAR